MKILSNAIYSFKNRKYSLLHCLLFVLLMYFIFHAIAGNRGMLAYLRLHNNIESIAKEADTLKAERIELEHKVNLLKSSIDLDMLDEQARKVLGLAKEGENVFVVQPNKDIK